MRRAAWLFLAACGRLRFDPRTGPGDGALGDGRLGDVAVADAAAPAWSHLVAYADQTCAAFGNDAYCWGANGSGQLGNGTIVNAGMPTRVTLPVGPFGGITQGDTHGCAIVDGHVFCFGSTVGTATPTLVTLPAPATVVGAGRGFTCASADVTYCWGSNNVGQLGVGDTNARAAPTAVTPLQGFASFTTLSVGDDHACGVRQSGSTACWGHNDNGALGDGMTQAQQGFAMVPTYTTPQLPGPISIAGWHACAQNGTNLSCWGRGVEGEIGNGSTADQSTPVGVIVDTTLFVTGGGPTDYDATCAVDVTASKLVCWGAGAFGRLGNGVAANSSSPVPVLGLPGLPTELAIGYDHACALVAGDIWCWGRGDSGQLGDGKMTNSLAPVLVAKP